MLKSFTYRLYPTKRQQRLLSEQLEELRWLWNTLLAQRKQAWEERQETVDYYEQKAELPSLNADVRPGLNHHLSKSIQDAGWAAILSVRRHSCPAGGTSLHRDHNAALNILALGTKQSAVGQTVQASMWPDGASVA
jgi:transposase